MLIKDWKKDLFTIPNLLSLFRLVLIPVYIVIYLNATEMTDYFIAAGILAGADLSVMDMLVYNFLPVTVGNIIGGAVLIGGGYWYIYRKGINQNG